MAFSPRQEQATALCAAGLSHKQIAQRMGISVHTVRTYLQRAKRRNSCKSSMELAIRYAVQEALAK